MSTIHRYRIGYTLPYQRIFRQNVGGISHCSASIRSYTHQMHFLNIVIFRNISHTLELSTVGLHRAKKKLHGVDLICLAAYAELNFRYRQSRLFALFFRRRDNSAYAECAGINRQARQKAKWRTLRGRYDFALITKSDFIRTEL